MVTPALPDTVAAMTATFRFAGSPTRPEMALTDAATFLGVTPEHLCAWIRRGHLPVRDSGTGVTIDVAAVAQLYAARDPQRSAADVFDDLVARDDVADALEQLAAGDVFPLDVDSIDTDLFGGPPAN
jgi:hypothetical protein